MLRVMAHLHRAATKRLVAEQQFAQGAAAQFIHVQVGVKQLATRRHAAGEYPGLAMAAQKHFTHPANAAFAHVQRLAFVAAQGLPAFLKRGDGEGVVGQRNKTASERAVIKQPVEHRSTGCRLQVVGGQPVGGISEGGVRHGGNIGGNRGGELSMFACFARGGCTALAVNLGARSNNNI